MINQTDMTPASALDIVTYGYKAVLAKLGPLTRLSLPLLLMAGGSQAGAFWLELNGKEGDGLAVLGIAIMTVLLGVVSALGLLYLTYSMSRYVRDLFFASNPENSVYAYLIPKMTLWGVVRIGFLVGLLAIPAFIAGVIGTIMLVVPGVMIFSLFYVWSSLFYVAYLAKPEQGIFDSMSEIGALMKGNMLRAIGLGILTNVIFFLLYAPFMMLEVGAEFLKEAPPSFVGEPWFIMLYGLLMTASGWVNLVIGTGGMLFVLNRFYADLHIRHADNKTLIMQGIHRPEVVNLG